MSLTQVTSLGYNAIAFAPNTTASTSPSPHILLYMISGASFRSTLGSRPLTSAAQAVIANFQNQLSLLGSLQAPKFTYVPMQPSDIPGIVYRTDLKFLFGSEWCRAVSHITGVIFYEDDGFGNPSDPGINGTKVCL